MTKRSLEEDRVYVAHISGSQSIVGQWQVTTVRLHQEPEAETTEKRRRLTHALISILSSTTQAYLPRDGATRSGLGPLTSRQSFTDVPTGQSDPANPSIVAAFSYDSGPGQVDC